MRWSKKSGEEDAYLTKREIENFQTRGHEFCCFSNCHHYIQFFSDSVLSDIFRFYYFIYLRRSKKCEKGGGCLFSKERKWKGLFERRGSRTELDTMRSSACKKSRQRCAPYVLNPHGTIWRKIKRAIFQTFWKDEDCANFLFFELECLFPLTVQSFSNIGQHWY